MTSGGPTLWISLDSREEVQGGGLGGKAESLRWLCSLGLPVPRGFVLTSASFFTWLGAGGLQADFEELRQGLESPDSEGYVSAALNFQQRALEVPLPGPVREALKRGMEALGDVSLLAVRSSGSLEDSQEASFAGLYETYLDVLPAEIEISVRRCWASLFTPRSLHYLRGRRLATGDLSMSVVVQEMIAGRVSGVCFSVNPVTGREDEVVVEVVPGRGDALVSGRKTPSRLIFRGCDPEVFCEFQEDLPPEQRETLTTQIQQELLPRVRDLCRRRGVPLDLEFVLDERGLWIVQTRPVTRVLFSPELGEWTNADFNEGGVSSGVCSQFMWSLYDFIWRNTLPEYFYRIGLLEDRRRPVQWARVFFGVPYWNVGEVKRCLHRVPGFNERNFDEDLGIEKDYAGEPWKTPVTPWTLLHALPVLFFMYREFGRQKTTSRRLLEEFPSREGYYLSVDLEATSDEVFFELFRKLILEDYAWVEGTYFMTIFNSSNAKLEFKSAFDALSRKVPGGLSYLALMSGMRGLRTLASVHDLHRLSARIVACPEWKEKLEAREGDDLVAAFENRIPFEEPWTSIESYLETHAHHSMKELDLRVPRWGEDVSFVLERIQKSVRDFDVERAPEVLEERQFQRFEEERRRALASFGWNLPGRFLFDLALKRSREYCWLREEVRDRSTRLYRVIRLYLLELARRLVERGVLLQPEEIFFLPFRACLDVTRGALSTEEIRTMVETNRSYLESFRNFEAPREVGARFRPRPRDMDVGKRILTGVGGAPGCAQGPAKVVRDLSESGKVERGDILVAQFTDPGWTPLLEHVSGVVTEVGGVLSHAAVISREYGVPAVLSVRDVTRLLHDGVQVEVDGDRGQVRLPS